MSTDTMNPKPSSAGRLTPREVSTPTTSDRQSQDTRRSLKFFLWPTAAVLAVVFLFAFFVSRTPALFDVPAHVESRTSGPPAPGAAMTSVIIEVVDTLLDKPGGYLSNDVTPPTVLLDNLPSWEFGVVTEVRDVVRALRNDFSRAKSQSAEDADLSKADVQFHFDHGHWILPSTEDEYRQGQAALERYLERLQAGDAPFYARADNLYFYLATVEKRLGNLSQRLSESVREPFLRELISGYGNVPAVQTLTPWLDIDNAFFETRGYVWALLHVLKSVEIDFASVLADKDAALLLRQIIHNLEQTQHPLFSPMVLNSTGFGMLTNHSLVMASYISRANAAVIDLRQQLSQG